MIRQELSRHLDHDTNFRWRGEAVTRIENLSDIVFALALGMLVSVSAPPRTYSDLAPYLMSIVPVAACFAALLVIWNAHFTFFRRYGVADGYVIFLNAVLLLFILFVAYPLRFALDSLFAWLVIVFRDDARLMVDLGIRNAQQAGYIIAWFFAGQAFIYFIIQLMYKHALTKAKILDLNSTERVMTLRSIWRYRCEMTISALIAVGAAFTPLGPFTAVLGILNWPIAVGIRQRFKLSPDHSEPMVS